LKAAPSSRRLWQRVGGIHSLLSNQRHAIHRNLNRPSSNCRHRFDSLPYLQVVDGNWGVHAIVPKKPFGLPGTAPASTTAQVDAASTPSPVAAPAPAPSGGISTFSAAVGAMTMLVAGVLAAVLM
jgi:hypothetical protein